MGDVLDVNLAVSLHAVNDEVRDTLVPINRKWPIADLMKASATIPALSNAKRVTFEYVMLKGINDSPAEARALVRLLRRHPQEGALVATGFRPASPHAFEAAVRVLGVVGLVEVVREEIDQAVPLRLVALLDRIDDHHQAVRASRPGPFRRGLGCASLAAARASGTTIR